MTRNERLPLGIRVVTTAEKRRDRARQALVGSLLGFVSIAAARDIAGNVLNAIEDGEDPFTTLKESATVRRHIAPEAIEDAAAIAANAWRRAMELKPAKSTRLTRFALAVGAGIDPYQAARIAREEDQ